MTDKERALLILERWVSDLASKDRTWKNVSANFEELFSTLSENNISYDTAHDLAKDAISHHLPSDAMIRYTYKASKKRSYMSEKEFGEDWVKDITNKGYAAFHDFYKMEGEAPEKQYGNISAAEYNRLRERALSFPVLDLAALKKQMNGEGQKDEN
jgi:hypothetical protein